MTARFWSASALFLTLAVLGFASFCVPAAADDENGSLSGHIRTSRFGAAAGVIVRLVVVPDYDRKVGDPFLQAPYQTVTDKRGFFVLLGLPAGQYLMQLSPAAADPLDEGTIVWTDVDAGETHALRLTLCPGAAHRESGP